MGKLCLITGNDEFAIKDMAREAIVALCGNNFRDDPGLEIVKGDDETKKPVDILQELVGALNAPPFLTPNKTIWLKHFQHFDKTLSSTSKAKLPEITPVAEFIKAGLPDDVILIMDGPGVDRRKSFFKICQKAGEIHFLEKADLSDKNFAVSQFKKIKEFCSEHSKNIDPRAIEYMAETLGSDSARLRNELEKLLCYIGNNDSITLEDCREICSKTPEALSWAFADALIAKDTRKGLDAINTLMEQLRAGKGSGNSELAILIFAVKRFQELIKTKAAAEELNYSRNSGKNFFYSLPPSAKEQHPDNFLLSLHPFRAYKLCENAQNFSDKEIASAIDVLLETNRQLVSGGSNSRIALEQLVFKIAKQNGR